MGSPTAIAQAIHTTEGNSAYDAACKKILSNKIILAWIMKSCLEEYRDLDVTEIAEKYIEAKEAEWQRYRASVSEWEIQEYLYRY